MKLRNLHRLCRTGCFYVSILLIVPITLLCTLLAINHISSEITSLKKYRAWLEDVGPGVYIEKYYMPDLEDYIRHNYVIEGDSVRFNTQWRPVLNNRIDHYYRDGENVYWTNAEYTNPTGDPLIYEADAETFMIAIGTGYAKDKSHVYYPYRQLKDAPIYQYMPPLANCPAGIVYDANPETFQCLGWGFATDGKRMYFQGRKIRWEKAFYDPAVCRRMYDLLGKFVCDLNNPISQ